MTSTNRVTDKFLHLVRAALIQFLSLNRLPCSEISQVTELLDTAGYMKRTTRVFVIVMWRRGVNKGDRTIRSEDDMCPDTQMETCSPLSGVSSRGQRVTSMVERQRLRSLGPGTGTRAFGLWAQGFLWRCNRLGGCRAGKRSLEPSDTPVGGASQGLSGGRPSTGLVLWKDPSAGNKRWKVILSSSKKVAVLRTVP